MKKMVMLLLIGGILLLSSFGFLQEDLCVNLTSNSLTTPGSKGAEFPISPFGFLDNGSTTNGGGGCGSGDPTPG